MKKILIYNLLLFSLGATSCKKYLDAKPNANLSTPESIADLQGILDDGNDYMNVNLSDQGDAASDNYYVTDESFNNLPNIQMKDAYLWQTDNAVGTSGDWNAEYTVVYRANVVLENLLNFSRNSSNALAWDNCKGQALVFRAKSFWEVAQVWTKAYDKSTANTDLGIPLKLSSNYNLKTTRASIQLTYDQIISDLKQAIPLLPNTPVFPFRPSRPAAYGYLARTYLAMRDYANARLYSDSCLQIDHALQDYNIGLSPTDPYPFDLIPYTNPEVVMNSTQGVLYYSNYQGFAIVDPQLFQSYVSNDLRKSIYYQARPDGTFFFRGSYSASYAFFNGIATDEMFLTRAECEARAGDMQDAMQDLNTVLVKRWVTNTFVPYSAISATDALSQILSERRKELNDRGLRFTDIKRLNKEGANIIQTRIIGGKTYTLQPNDPKYARPIPYDVILLGGIPQNPGD